MTNEPVWIAYARSLIGTKEAPEAANNPTIMGWAKRLGTKILGIVYNADSTPWCGLFVAQCVAEAGLTPPSIAVRASSWDGWGVACKPTVGAILRFQRSGGGHVGFYIAEDVEAFYVLGGNQSDAVTITRIAKNRLVACRWPSGVAITTKPVVVSVTKGPVSKNEA